MVLNLHEAKLLCERLGFSKRAITCIRLRTGMHEDAVRTLAQQYICLKERLKEASLRRQDLS